MSDRVCVRGCTQRDVHWATCERSGPEWQAASGACPGCAPRECRDGSLICDTCFGKARWLTDHAAELLVRIETKIDPRSARTGGENKRTRPVHAPEVVDSDSLDAMTAVRATIGADVQGMANDLEAVEWLGYAVLDRHPVYEDGTREAWSVQDAMDRWGLEDKATPHRFVFPDDGDGEEPAVAVREWFDPLLTVLEAAKLRGVNERTARKWVTKGLVGPVAKAKEGRQTVTRAHLSAWFNVNPCPIVHDGEWCTRVDGHDGACTLRPGTRPINRHQGEAA